MQSFNAITKLFAIACLLSLNVPVMVYAQGFPAMVSEQVAPSLDRVGGGTYRKLGFTIYHATLWAPDGEYDKNGPYALQLQYARRLSQKTLNDTVIDNIREQEVADEETFRRWQDALYKMLPAVMRGDEIVGVSIPGKSSILYFNGTEIARIEDRAFSDAFFGIWLGPKADEILYAQLMGQ